MKRLAIITLIGLSACTAPEYSEDTLRQAGYSDVKIGGWAPLSCGNDDMFSTRFQAKNPVGNLTSGVVCCGLMKMCTIRH